MTIFLDYNATSPLRPEVKKAIMNLRVLDGMPVFEGEQINIGGNESYIAVCRKHFKQAMDEKHYSEREEND